MAFIIDNLSSDWQTVDASKDADIEGYKEYLICHRCSIDNTKQEFKYSASEVKNDSKPVELVIQGAKGKDPLKGIQRPMLKVKESKVVGMDVYGERCERKQ